MRPVMLSIIQNTGHFYCTDFLLYEFCVIHIPTIICNSAYGLLLDSWAEYHRINSEVS